MVNVKELQATTRKNSGATEDDILQKNLAELEERVRRAAQNGEHHLSDVTWMGFYGDGKPDAHRALYEFAKQSGCRLSYSYTTHGSEYFRLEW